MFNKEERKNNSKKCKMLIVEEERSEEVNGALCFRKIHFHPTWIYGFRNLRFKAEHERELSCSTWSSNMWVFSVLLKLRPGKETEVILLGARTKKICAVG